MSLVLPWLIRWTHLYSIHEREGPKGPTGPLMGLSPVSCLQGLAKLACSANLLLVLNKNIQIISMNTMSPTEMIGYKQIMHLATLSRHTFCLSGVHWVTSQVDFFKVCFLHNFTTLYGISRQTALKTHLSIIKYRFVSF
jgi:hypothetical protein